jgi:hypothetical protein
MRKYIFLFITLLAAFSAPAENYFTIDGAVNDTLLIDPVHLGNGLTVKVRAHFDGRLDRWTITATYPDSIPVNYVAADTCMLFVPYVNSSGIDSYYSAPLAVGNNYRSIASVITANGYWDPDGDGIYESYGTIKWEGGDHSPMFHISLDLRFDCSGDSITFNSDVQSTPDDREGTTNGRGYRRIILKVGYQRGDVNGDGLLNTTDVTALINYLLSHDGLNQYQLEAADVNGDGNVSMYDVSALINLLLANGQNVNPNDFDFGTES